MFVRGEVQSHNMYGTAQRRGLLWVAVWGARSPIDARKILFMREQCDVVHSVYVYDDFDFVDLCAVETDSRAKIHGLCQRW